MEPLECVKEIEAEDPIGPRTVRLRDSTWDYVRGRVDGSNERGLTYSLFIERLILRDRDRQARAQARRSA